MPQNRAPIDRTRRVVKRRIGNKVQSVSFASSEEANAYRTYLSELKQIDRDYVAKEQELEHALDTMEEVFKQIVEQTFICRNAVKRKYKWINSKCIRTHLSPQEISHIRRIKDNAVECPYPNIFQNSH